MGTPEGAPSSEEFFAERPGDSLYCRLILLRLALRHMDATAGESEAPKVADHITRTAADQPSPDQKM